MKKLNKDDFEILSADSGNYVVVTEGNDPKKWVYLLTTGKLHSHSKGLVSDDLYYHQSKKAAQTALANYFKPMKNTTVEIDGTSFEIDLDKAKELGIIRVLKPVITDVKSGDVFASESGHPIAVAIYDYENSGYRWVNHDGFSLYSDPIKTKREMIDHVNHLGWKYIKNIKEEYKNLIQNL